MISVVIPTRNCMQFLPSAVDSVAAQSVADWELIVVDDDSEDGTWDWLQSLEDKRIRAIRMEKRSWQSAARNTGLHAARGEFVLFLDHDDFLMPGALTRLLEALVSHPNAIAAVGARQDVRSDGSRRVPHPRRPHLRDAWIDAMFGWVPQCGQVLAQRRAVMQSGGWKDAFIPAEDHDYWVRLSRLGPVALIPQIVLGYRIHPTQTLKVFEASRNARTIRTVALRRAYVSGLSGGDRARGERTVGAWRHQWIAARAFRRRNYRVACLHCWKEVRQAPWLLRSPLCRHEITGLTVRSLVGLTLGDPAVRLLRYAKRALTAAAHKHRPVTAFTRGRPI